MDKPVYMEDWWLDAVTGGEWDAVSVEQGGRREGWLPYAWSRSMGFRQCGLPPLGRLLFPIVDIPALKREARDRARFHIEDRLIGALPKASYYHFILPPDDSSALAWQAHGFTARVQHTFVVDADRDEAELWSQLRDKTRNVVRRARDSLDVRELGVEDFARIYADHHGAKIGVGHRERVTRVAAAAVGRGQGRAVAAFDRQGSPHAAILFVWDTRDAYFFLATRDPVHAELGAMAVLVWNGMADARSRGLRFDFDGVSTRGRLRFMQPFAGRLASRVVVERGSLAYGARFWLRELNHRLRSSRQDDRFY